MNIPKAAKPELRSREHVTPTVGRREEPISRELNHGFIHNLSVNKSITSF